jgi:murein DD-endopeptidase MepM/ murein hydrolase activator NlpD
MSERVRLVEAENYVFENAILFNYTSDIRTDATQFRQLAEASWTRCDSDSWGRFEVVFRLVTRLNDLFTRSRFSCRVRRRRFALAVDCMPLEARCLLAANLKLTGITLENGLGQAVSTFGPGESIRIRAQWETAELPATTSYDLRFRVDGVDLAHVGDTRGAGTASGAGLWLRWGWYAGTAGTQHSVSVTIDPANTIAESNESDNTLSFNFVVAATTDLPQPFIWPVAGIQGREWTVVGYTDVDPRPGQATDYRGGSYMYDGHDAIDIGVANFSAMDAGIPVVAAAGGRVVYVHDGEPDRETLTLNENPNVRSNTVIVDHGSGWLTSYSHLASGSITVAKDDIVQPQQQLGLVGSSGNSNGAHLHFTVLRHVTSISPLGHTNPHMPVETMRAPALYFRNAPTYAGDLPTFVTAFGLTNLDTQPDVNKQERPSDKISYLTTGSDTPLFWYQRTNPRATDVIQVIWRRPDGTIVETDAPFVSIERWQFRTLSLDNANWRQFPGTWSVVLNVNSVELARQTFELRSSNSPPEIRVALDGLQIPDGRTTSVNFGEVAPGTTSPQRTFVIRNHGDSTLTIASVTLPAGFVTVGTVPVSIPAGQTANLQVAMSTIAAGVFHGDIRLQTNDPDEGDFNFRLTGIVTTANAGALPVINPSGRAAIFRKGLTTLIDPVATVSLPGASSQNGLRLQAVLITGNRTSDQLLVQSQGNSAGQISLSGTDLRFGGILIGSLTSVQSGQAVDVVFNSSATTVAVQATLRALQFRAGDVSFTSARRTVGLQLIRPDGARSLLRTVAMTGAHETLFVAPTIISPAATTLDKRPLLQWSPVADATSYELWIIQVGNTAGPFLRTTIAGAQYQPLSDFPIGRYQIWVRAVYPTGQTAVWSAVHRFQVATRATLTAPAARQSSPRPQFSWEPLSGAARYDLWVDNRSTGQQQVIRQTSLTGTSWTASSDLPLGEYQVWIRGFDATGTAATWSVSRQFTVATQPQLVAPVAVMTLAPRPALTWTAVPGAATYDVFLRNLQTNALTNPTGITGTVWTPANDLPPANYRWWIRGVSAQNMRGDWSQPAEFNSGGRTAVTAPVGTTSSAQPLFSWKPVTGATRYELWVNRIGGAAQVIHQTQLTTTSFVPAATLAAGQYRVWVRAFSGGIAGVWSNPLDFQIL